MANGSGRVVLAEDDAALRSLLAEALARMGLEVDEARDGFELDARLAALAGAPADLVVTDVRLPGLTGLTAIARLRRSDFTTRVLVITAYAEPETRRFAAELSATILEKPFDLSRFRDAVAALLAA